jgi:hypothetical protein
MIGLIATMRKARPTATCHRHEAEEADEVGAIGEADEASGRRHASRIASA